ncbi:MAG: helix-turn-helix domain-containing protein [Rikenellaceae bacterium]
MEVITIEKRCFEELLQLTKILTERVAALNEKFRDKSMDEWLDGQEVCLALNISQRTLQTLRDKRIIGYTQLNRKFFYRPKEVLQLLPAIDKYRD